MTRKTNTWIGFAQKTVAMIVAATLVLAVIPTVLAQEDSNGRQLEVGDLIEFQFLGETYRSRITKFTGTGWPYVKFEYNGRTKERFFADSNVTLIEEGSGSADSAGAESGMPTQEFRTWTNDDGRFSVEAKLLSIDDGKVELEKKDGLTINVDVNILSQADQDYVASVETAMSEPPAVNPFAGGTVKAAPSTRTGGSDRGNSVVQPVDPDFGSNELLLRNADWTVSPDTRPVVPGRANVTNIATSFGDKEFHNKISTPSLSPDRKTLAIVTSNPFKDESEIVTIDMETGQASRPVVIPQKGAGLIAADNGIVVTERERRGSRGGGLDFWSLEGGTAQLTSSWNGSRSFEPKAGRFLEPNRLLTTGKQVVLWDTQNAKAIYSLNTGRNTVTATSPGGNQLAIASKDSVYFVDVNSGQMLGTINLPVTSLASMAFSQDGKFLAGIYSAAGEVLIWDLEAEELVKRFGVPGGSASQVIWCDNNHVLVNNRLLIDIDLQVVVWNYQLEARSKIFTTDDGRFWFQSRTKMLPIELPHRDMSSKTAGLNAEDLVVFRSGKEVSLELNGIPSSEQQKVRDRMTAQLEKVGIEVIRNADLRLVASYKKLERETVEVSSMFPAPGRFGRGSTETISYTPTVLSARLFDDDQVVWAKTQRFGPGPIIHTRQGESTQATANRMCKPNYSVLHGISLPEQISQLPNGKPFGSSTINERGVR